MIPAIGTLTSAKIRSYLEEAEQRYFAKSGKNKQYYRALEKKVEAFEQKVIKESHYCPSFTEGDAVSDQAVDETLKQNFYDAKKMRHLYCTLDSVLRSPQPIDGRVRTFINGMRTLQKKTVGTEPVKQERTRESVKTSFSNLNVIGEPSVDGIASVADFRTVEDAFVLKVPRSSRDPELLTHETVVGTALNVLRSKIPNFAYVFGGFQCSPPVFKKGQKEPVSWCDSMENAVRYVLYENISPSVSFADFCKDCTLKDYLNVYVQLLLGLQLASDELSFTHYDLHHHNALIRTPEKTLLIPYPTPKGTKIVKADHLAAVIDFGRANLKVDGQWVADFVQVRTGSDPESTNPYHDAYKILMFTLRDLLRSNPSVYVYAKRIFRFFNATEDCAVALANQADDLYVIPSNARELEGRTLYELVDYIVAQFPNFKLLHDPDDLDMLELECPAGVTKSSGVCVTSTPSKDLTALDYASPDSVEELFQLKPFLTKKQYEELVESMVDLPQLYAQGERELQEYKRQLLEVWKVRDLQNYDEAALRELKVFLAEMAQESVYSALELADPDEITDDTYTDLVDIYRGVLSRFKTTSANFEDYSLRKRYRDVILPLDYMNNVSLNDKVELESILSSPEDYGPEKIAYAKQLLQNIYRVNADFPDSIIEGFQIDEFPSDEDAQRLIQTALIRSDALVQEINSVIRLGKSLLIVLSAFEAYYTAAKALDSAAEALGKDSSHQKDADKFFSDNMQTQVNNLYKALVFTYNGIKAEKFDWDDDIAGEIENAPFWLFRDILAPYVRE